MERSSRACLVSGELESRKTHINQCDMWLSFLKDKRFKAVTLSSQIRDEVSHERLMFGVKTEACEATQLPECN